MDDRFVINVFSDFLGEYRKHNHRKGQISFDCPACSLMKEMPEGDGKGNLEINYIKGKYKCWACYDINQMQGNVPMLIKRYGTRKNLSDYYLYKPDDYVNSHEANPNKVVELPKEFISLNKDNSGAFLYREAMFYLKSRNITEELIEYYNIGFCNSGEYYGRIIFPSYDEYGIINYFVGRWFLPQKNKLKYLNPESEKENIIFNENKINWDSTIYLVEGVTDHIVIPNSTPLLGKKISRTLIEKLHENSSGLIVIVYDGDAIEDAKNVYFGLNCGVLKDRIRMCQTPEKYDPSKIYQKLGKDGIYKLLRTARMLTRKEIMNCYTRDSNFS